MGTGKPPQIYSEGDEARVVLIGEPERLVQQLNHTSVVRGPGMLQPFEHFLRVLAQGIDLGNLAAAFSFLLLNS